MGGMVFHPPPNWPKPPDGWSPPDGWKPDPSWPPPPPGWKLWIPQTTQADTRTMSAAASAITTATQATPPPPPSKASSPQPPVSLPESHDARRADALLAEVERLQAEVASLRARTPQDTDDVIDLNDERVLQEVGIYHYHHPLENAVEYKDRLKPAGVSEGQTAEDPSGPGFS